VNALDDRRPREKTWRNSAGRLIRCLVGRDTECGLLNGEPQPALASATCENRATAFAAHSWSEAVDALASAGFWLVGTLWHIWWSGALWLMKLGTCGGVAW